MTIKGDVYKLISGFRRVGIKKVEKIIQKFKNTPHGHSFEECAKVLETLGYVMNTKQGKGKHVKFTKPGKPMVIIPKKNPVSPATVNDIIKIHEEN